MYSIKWEYKVVHFLMNSRDYMQMEPFLNELGSQSWKAFHVMQTGDTLTFIFMRADDSGLNRLPVG